MAKCKECSSMAINHHLHGRDGSDGDLCDVCYWHDRAKQQAAVIEQMRGLIKRLVDVTPGHAGQCSGLKCREPYCYSCNDEESANEYLQGVWNLCGEANEVVLALQPCPEVLNKVRANAVRKAFKLMMDGRWRGDALDVLADRMEQGEA